MRAPGRAAYDCLRCGACCVNPTENREEGYIDYVEIKKNDALFRKPDLMKRFATWNDVGELHLKLDPLERCVALRGAVGRAVRCSLYAWRPAACRRIETGGKGCIQARIDCGIASVSRARARRTRPASARPQRPPRGSRP